MRILGNIIWFIFGGFINAAAWYILGAILYITVVGIPLGKQFFKMGKIMITPFGKNIDVNFSEYPILNIIWIILLGWALTISNLGLGVLYCITIVGIPFGLQMFKIAKLSFMPFGAKVV